MESQPITGAQWCYQHNDHLPAKYNAFTWEGWSASWKMITDPSWPSRDVGHPHSLSWVPAEIILVINSGFVSSPPQLAGERIPPSDVRWGRIGEEKGGSGIWDGGGVVVLWPAEPMQQEVNGWKPKCKEKIILNNATEKYQLSLRLSQKSIR